MGRKKTDYIERLRSKLWCRLVVNETGKSLYELNKEFFGNQFKLLEDGSTSRPTTWESYNRIGKCPPRELVERVGKTCPIALNYYNDPFWSIASDKELTEPEILTWLQLWAPKTLSGFKLVGGKLTTNSYLPGTVDGLFKKGDLTSLGALIALARLAKEYRHGSLYLDAVESSLHVLIFNLSQTDLGLISDELFPYIKSRFLSEPVCRHVLYEDCLNIDLYTESLDDSLNILIDRKIIKSDLRSKSKATCYLWRDQYITDYLTTLRYTKDHERAHALRDIQAILTEDGRSHQRRHLLFQIYMMRHGVQFYKELLAAGDDVDRIHFSHLEM